MTNLQAETPEWLTLKQAAHKLGVHPSTLRRWADNDEISYLLTPGGHRRFSDEEVIRFAEEKQRLRKVGNLERVWEEQALMRTRHEIAGHPHKPWLVGLSQEYRQQSRLMGQRLMGLTLQFIAVTEPNDHILDEAKNIGCQYAEAAQTMDLSLADVLEATQFFRDAMVEVVLQLPERVHIRPETNLHLMRRINTLLNAVQLSIVEAYEKYP